MPNFPHFRVDEDDVCDPTITSLFDIPIEVDVGLDIYPNPTAGELKVLLPEVIVGRLSVSDITGQVLLTQGIDYLSEVELDLSGYPAGLYVVEVVSGIGDRYVEKVVVQD
jgi:hypothetical protein